MERAWPVLPICPPLSSRGLKAGQRVLRLLTFALFVPKPSVLSSYYEFCAGIFFSLVFNLIVPCSLLSIADFPGFAFPFCFSFRFFRVRDGFERKWQPFWQAVSSAHLRTGVPFFSSPLGPPFSEEHLPTLNRRLPPTTALRSKGKEGFLSDRGFVDVPLLLPDLGHVLFSPFICPFVVASDPVPIGFMTGLSLPPYVHKHHGDLPNIISFPGIVSKIVPVTSPELAAALALLVAIRVLCASIEFSRPVYQAISPPCVLLQCLRSGRFDSLIPLFPKFQKTLFESLFFFSYSLGFLCECCLRLLNGFCFSHEYPLPPHPY